MLRNRIYASIVVLLTARAGLAGQIIIDPKAATDKPAETAHRVKPEPHQTVILTLPASSVIMDSDDEEGFFPQHGDDSLLEGKARDARERARESQSKEAASPENAVDPADTSARDGVAANVSKARAYMKNSTSQRINELPVVSCDNVNNVTGRIGDDSQSGSIITILVNGKQEKARCK